jgi:hypothetical protein
MIKNNVEYLKEYEIIKRNVECLYGYGVILRCAGMIRIMVGSLGG